MADEEAEMGFAPPPTPPDKSKPAVPARGRRLGGERQPEQTETRPRGVAKSRTIPGGPALLTGAAGGTATLATLATVTSPGQLALMGVGGAVLGTGAYVHRRRKRAADGAGTRTIRTRMTRTRTQGSSSSTGGGLGRNPLARLMGGTRRAGSAGGGGSGTRSSGRASGFRMPGLGLTRGGRAGRGGVGTPGGGRGVGARGTGGRPAAGRGLRWPTLRRGTGMGGGKGRGPTAWGGGVGLGKGRGGAGTPGRGTPGRRTSPGGGAGAVLRGLRKGGTPTAAGRYAGALAARRARQRGLAAPRLRGLTAAILAGGLAGVRGVYRRARTEKPMRRLRDEKDVMDALYGRDRGPGGTRRQRPSTRAGRPTGSTTRPTGTRPPAPVPLPRPSPDPAAVHPAGTKPTATGGATMAQHPSIPLSEQIVKVAQKRNREGMLDVLADANAWPLMMDNVAKAVETEAAQFRNFPVHGSIHDLYATAVRNARATAAALAAVPVAIERIHAQKLEELRNPSVVGPNPQMWDHSKNKSGGAK